MIILTPSRRVTSSGPSRVRTRKAIASSSTPLSRTPSRDRRRHHSPFTHKRISVLSGVLSRLSCYVYGFVPSPLPCLPTSSFAHDDDPPQILHRGHHASVPSPPKYPPDGLQRCVQPYLTSLSRFRAVCPSLLPWTQPRPSDPRVLLRPLPAISVAVDTITGGLTIKHSPEPYLPTSEPALPVDRPPLPSYSPISALPHPHSYPQYNALASSVPVFLFQRQSESNRIREGREIKTCLPLASWTTLGIAWFAALEDCIPFFLLLQPRILHTTIQTPFAGPAGLTWSNRRSLPARTRAPGRPRGLPRTLAPAYTCPMSLISSHSPSRRIRLGHIYLSKTPG
jgi:hypothetical protein